MMSLSFMIIRSSPSSLTSAGPLAEQHPVAGLELDRMELAVLAARARPGGDDLAFHGFFLSSVGGDDAAGGLGLLGDAPHQDAVVQGTEFHAFLLRVA